MSLQNIEGELLPEIGYHIHKKNKFVKAGGDKKWFAK